MSEPPPSPPDDPLAALAAWREEARGCGALEPDAMALATATPDGVPSVRMVLCRGIEPRALWFFTNYESRKGHELAHNSAAAVAFHWERLARQVRIEGRVERLTPAQSDAYFASRPRGHQLGSVASPQSSEIASLDEVRARAEALRVAHEGGAVPRPDHWGGFRLAADRVELWVGREDRIHQRWLYTWRDERWAITYLAP